MLKAITDSLLSVAFPQNCHICRRPVTNRADGVACASCWAQTRGFGADTPLCAKCGNLIPSSVSHAEAFCRECSDLEYDSAVAGGAYENALAAVVLELKKAPHLPARACDLLLSAFDRANADSTDIIIPVPLSPKRRIERGFNQAEVIGRYLSKRAGIELDASTLIRHKHTPVHRVAMDSKAREQSVKNSFRVVSPALVKDRSVLLVDDILTTGSTASNCAKELKKNGAACVKVLTLARAVRGSI